MVLLNLAMLLVPQDSKSEISHVHLEKLPSEVITDVLSILSVLFATNEV